MPTGRFAARSARPTSRRGSAAGSYATRGPARHRYDFGLSYSTQRYDGGNPAALRDVTDGSRNAGRSMASTRSRLRRRSALTYGARYARYDYLDSQRPAQSARRVHVPAGRVVLA